MKKNLKYTAFISPWTQTTFPNMIWRQSMLNDLVKKTNSKDSFYVLFPTKSLCLNNGEKVPLLMDEISSMLHDFSVDS